MQDGIHLELQTVEDLVDGQRVWFLHFRVRGSSASQTGSPESPCSEHPAITERLLHSLNDLEQFYCSAMLLRSPGKKKQRMVVANLKQENAGPDI